MGSVTNSTALAATVNQLTPLMQTLRRGNSDLSVAVQVQTMGSFFFSDPCESLSLTSFLPSCRNSADIETCLLQNAESKCPTLKERLTDTVAQQFSRFFNSTNAISFMKHIPQDCLTLNCSDVNKNHIHPRSLHAADIIATRNQKKNWYDFNHLPPEWKDVQELLRLNAIDPREKLLFLTAEDDHNGALNPNNIPTILSKLALRYDLKYGVVENFQQICEQIAASQKAGLLGHIVLSGHGNRYSILLSKGSPGKYHLVDDQNFTECFAPLAPYGKITLLSCSTGKPNPTGYPLDNLAQKISERAQRTVIAPKDLAYPAFTSLLNPDSDVFYHPYNRLLQLVPFYNTNLFSAFRPTFNKCTKKIPAAQVHEKEISAAKVVKSSLEGLTLYPSDSIRPSDEFLRHCKDDPRDKLLLLGTEFFKDHWFSNEGPSPTNYGHFFPHLADHYDFRYKVVSSIPEICKYAKMASKAGHLSAVILFGHVSNAKEGMQLSQTQHLDRKNAHEMACLDEVAPEGSIVLLGASLGKINEPHSESLAQVIADKTQRIVQAATCPLFPNELTLASLDPVNVTHPEHSFLNKARTGCWESGQDSLIKTYAPRR